MNPTPLPSQFDLLPPAFHESVRAGQVTRSWIATVVALTAVLASVAVATLIRTHQSHRANIQIASAALPLLKLRSDVDHLQSSNRTRSRLCAAVESARPSDNALQTIAAIGVSSQNGNRQILVDSIHLRLPIEYPATLAAPPAWAVGQLTVAARPLSDDALSGWIDRLNTFDRIESAVILASDVPAPSPAKDDAELRRIQITATPNSTRIVP